MKEKGRLHGQNGWAKGAMPWSEEYLESHVRQETKLRGAAQELRDLLEHRIGNWDLELAYSLWGINAPARIELTSGTWLSPSLAALNRPFGFLSGGLLTLLPTLLHTLPLQATPAEQDALRFPLLWTHLNMIRDGRGKRKTFLRAFSRKAKPQDKVQLLGRVDEKKENLAGFGLVSWPPFLSCSEKVRSCCREHPHWVIGPLVHANPKKLSRTSHMQGNLHVWFWPGFPEVSNNLASARRWRTSPNYCPFILE